MPSPNLFHLSTLGYNSDETLARYKLKAFFLEGSQLESFMEEAGCYFLA